MRNLKFAISNIAWDKEQDKEMYNFLKTVGISGLEIAPTRLFDDQPYEKLEEARKFKEKIKSEYCMDVCSMQSIWFGRNENIFAGEQDRTSLIDYTKKAIDFAKEIGCENLVFGCPKNRNIENNNLDAEQIACDFFKTINDYAFEKGVVVAIEPNPTIYNTNFLNTTKEAITFVKNLGCEAIKINCDLGTVLYNEESIDYIIKNIGLINHIHISEPNLLVPEKRNIHKMLIENLERTGYNKYVSIEMKKSDLDTVKKTIKYLLSL